LRAKRRNPEACEELDRFVANAPRNDDHQVQNVQLLSSSADRGRHRINDARRQRERRIRIGRRIRARIVRRDSLQDMIDIRKQNKLGLGRGAFEALGVGNADLHIAAALHDHDGLGDGSNQLRRIVGERIDQKALHLRREQRQQRGMHAGDVDTLAGFE
jgi:hypothetical protein